MLASLLVAVLAFPQGASLPRPASQLTWGAPVAQQGSPAIGSNGSMRFICWSDGRGSRFSLGTRVDPDGKPLDLHGIAIPDIAWPNAVTWTGEDFAVIGMTKSGRAVVFVGTDGAVSASIPIDVPAEYTLIAVSRSGPDARLLFVRYDSNASLDTRVVSARGDVLARVVTPLSAPLAVAPLTTRFIGAGRRSDFAVFGRSATVRLDRNGRVLEDRPVSWPFDYFDGESTAVAGLDGQGFVLLKQGPQYGTTPTVLAYQLDDHAALTGKTASLPLPWFWRLTQGRPLMAVDGDGFIVINEGRYGDDTPHEYVTRLSFDLTAETSQVPDAGAPLLLAVDGSPALVVTLKGQALYSQSLSALSDGVLLNFAPPMQYDVAVAATSHGYAVAWLEYGPGPQFQTFIRRFSTTGEPLDAAPLAVNAAPSDLGPTRTSYPTPPVLAATDEVYIVNGRRLDGSTGQWIDAAPASSVIAAASNGHAALLAVVGAGGTSLQQLPSSGGATSAPIRLPASAAGPVAVTADSRFRVALTSNGADYLVVWNTFFACLFECPAPPTPVYALRVRADGTWIDGSPVRLSANGWRPSVAWVGNSYVVTWIGPTGVRATRIAESGEVLDGTDDGVLVEGGITTGEDLSARIVSLGRDAILLVHHMPWSADPFWVGMRLEPGNLSAALTAERTQLPAGDSMDAVATAGRAVLVYSANVGASTGYVTRAYVQHLVDLVLRRRAIAR